MDRTLSLAGPLVLAILAVAHAAEAKAETFTTPGAFSFVVPASGDYAIEAVGAEGGQSRSSPLGTAGLGALVAGDVFLSVGEDLTLYVGGQGIFQESIGGGGGGGGSFIFGLTGLLAAAGGGGGVGFSSNVGGSGQTGPNGEAGVGADGGLGGATGQGGGGGTNSTFLIDFGGFAGYVNGGGGSGVNGFGSDGFGAESGGGGELPEGGSGYAGENGGFGGGGGGGYDGGGGGGGYSGGGGGGQLGGGGGGSFLASTFSNQVLTAGVNSGDGSISIELLEAVPEPSTWAMTLCGFVGLGWLLRRRKQRSC
jgi:hypothetical protein